MTYDICETGFENFEIHGMITHNTAPPFRVAEFYLSFGTGIDKCAGVCDMALACQVVGKKGATIFLKEDGSILGKGRMDFIKNVKADPILFKKLEELVKAAPPPDTDSDDDGEANDGEDKEAAPKSSKKPKGLGGNTVKRVPVKDDAVLPDGGEEVETTDA